MGERNASCSIDGCEKPQKQRQWCGMHYARWLRNGDPLVRTSRAPLPECCSIEDCDEPRYARGWCAVHYGRWFNHGSTDERTETVHCRTCGTSFVRFRQGQRLYCNGCRPLAVQESTRRHLAKIGPVLAAERQAARSQRGSVCEVCGDPVIDRPRYGRLPTVCSETCKAVRASQRARDWRQANGDKVRDAQHRRRAAKRNAPNEVISQAVLAERDGYTCQLCLRPVDMAKRWPDGASPSVDHKIPLSKKGTSHTYANVQLTHDQCNKRRGAKPLTDLAMLERIRALPL